MRRAIASRVQPLGIEGEPRYDEDAMTDAHIHLSLIPAALLAPYLLKSEQLGVYRWIMAGYNSTDWVRQIEILQQYPEKSIQPCFGIHPWSFQNATRESFELEWARLEDFLVRTPRALVGETGLDEFRKFTDVEKELQRESFGRHLRLARKLKRPVCLHIVQAHDEALGALSSISNQWQGLVHAFSGSREVAKQYTQLGLKISVGPAVLSTRFKKLRTAAVGLDDSEIVLETDSPQKPDDLESDPELYTQTLNELAALRRVSAVELARKVESNIEQLLKF